MPDILEDYTNSEGFIHAQEQAQASLGLSRLSLVPLSVTRFGPFANFDNIYFWIIYIESLLNLARTFLYQFFAVSSYPFNSFHRRKNLVFQWTCNTEHGQNCHAATCLNAYYGANWFIPEKDGSYFLPPSSTEFRYKFRWWTQHISHNNNQLKMSAWYDHARSVIQRNLMNGTRDTPVSKHSADILWETFMMNSNMSEDESLPAR